MSTSIEWVRGEDGSQGATWNFARGCSRVDAACTNCYAERMAHRFSGKGQPYEGLTVLGKQGVRWAGGARFIPEALSIPLKWRKGRRIFPCSMSDAFHEDLTNEQIAAAFGVMAATPQHTYVMTTKRAKRMREWFAWHARTVRERDWRYEPWRLCEGEAFEHLGDTMPARGCMTSWPLPNVHLGVSAGTQASANERIPYLLATPARVRWVSLEPLLEDVSVVKFLATPGCARPLANVGGDLVPALDWVVVGGESGPGARPCDLTWIRRAVAECKRANIPCFVKQLGTRPCSPVASDTDDESKLWLKLRDRKGGAMSEWPSDLRIRQFPG